MQFYDEKGGEGKYRESFRRKRELIPFSALKVE